MNKKLSSIGILSLLGLFLIFYIVTNFLLEKRDIKDKKEIDANKDVIKEQVNNDKQIQYQRNTIPFTSNPNPMDNYNEVYHCTDKQQSEKIQHQMKSYYRFKFEEKIIDYNNKW